MKRLPILTARVLVLALAAACSDASDVNAPNSRDPRPSGDGSPQLSVGTTALSPAGDTYVRDDGEHLGAGGQDTMWVRTLAGGERRALIRFDQAAIASYVGSDSLVSATLELTVQSKNWIPSGGYEVNAYRMTQSWTESGATWQCPNDTNTGNNTLDCPGGTWTMVGTPRPYATTATATASITGTQSEVSYDVTADVRAFLSGANTNHGWALLSPTTPPPSPQVKFWTRESASPPQLVITTAASDTSTPPPSGGNEPSGFTQLTEHTFTTNGEDNWTNSTDSEFSLVSDATAPESPSSVGRILFPDGFLDGHAPAHVTNEVFADNKHVYMSTYLKVSSNWEGHPIISKVGYLWTGGKPKLMLGLKGEGSDPLRVVVRLQDMNVETVPSDNLANNLSNGTFSRNAWHHIELVTEVNTLDQANGEVHLWVDGVKVAEHSNLNFNGSIKNPVGESQNDWHAASWRPVWGGQTNPRSEVDTDMYMYMDNYYLSGE